MLEEIERATTSNDGTRTTNATGERVMTLSPAVKLSPAERLLEVAAENTRQRIRKDRESAPAQIQRLLTYLESHLFDPELDASHLKRACNIRDNSIPIYFHDALNLPPYAYIEDCRMQTACRLLCDTDMKIWQIGQLIGYSNLQVFSRAFNRWSGTRPSQFRREEQDRLKAAGGRVLTEAEISREGVNGKRPEADTAVPVIGLEVLRRAVHGNLDKTEADKLAQRLADLYPKSFKEADEVLAAAPPSVRFDPSEWPQVSLDDFRGVEVAERMKAEEVWNELRRRPATEHAVLVSQKIQFRTTALFELLKTKCIEEGRQDRRYGVHLAQLALESIRGIRQDEELVVNLRVRGWANMSNALRLNDDYAGAEQAIVTAEKFLPRSPDPRSEAEYAHLKAALRWSQREIQEALALEEIAVGLFRDIGDSPSVVKALIMKAVLCQAADRPLDGVSYLEEAIPFAVKIGDPYLKSSVYQNLGLLYVDARKFELAAKLMPQVRACCEAVSDAFSWLQCSWLEGYVAQGLGEIEAAEKIFLGIREQCIELGRPTHAGLAALDLCLIYAQQRRAADVFATAKDALSLFHSLRQYDDALAAIQLLEQAVETRNLERAAIEHMKDSFQKLRRNPTVKL